MSGLIKQFLRDVDWGEVDFLVVDTPPGTSDEHLSIVQYLSNTYVDGAIIITTPQARTDTDRFITFLSRYLTEVLESVKCILFCLRCELVPSDSNCLSHLFPLSKPFTARLCIAKPVLLRQLLCSPPSPPPSTFFLEMSLVVVVLFFP